MWWAALLAAAGGVVHAENVAAARACVGIADKDARLACFDAAYAASSPSAAPRTAPVGVPAAAAPEAHFGDEGQLPAERLEQAKVPKTLTLTVQVATGLANGLYRLTLENGQIWRTTQSDQAVDFKSGDRITVRRTLGGYQVSQAGSGRTVGAKRIQ